MRSSPSEAALLRGSCLCAGVRYHAALPANHASHCYCTMCQKHHGAAAGSYVNLASDGFVIDAGLDLITEFASSPPARRGFCSVCGSSLYWRSSESPESIAVTIGTLDEAWQGPIEKEWFVEQKPDWLPSNMG
ncbi:MAG: GFA family protein [Massilia sp.]